MSSLWSFLLETLYVSSFATPVINSIYILNLTSVTVYILSTDRLRQSGGGQFTPGQYTPGRFTPGQFTPGQFTLGQFTPGQFTPGIISLNEASSFGK